MEIPCAVEHVSSLKFVTSMTSVSPSQCPVDHPIQKLSGALAGLPMFTTRARSHIRTKTRCAGHSARSGTGTAYRSREECQVDSTSLPDRVSPNSPRFPSSWRALQEDTGSRRLDDANAAGVASTAPSATMGPAWLRDLQIPIGRIHGLPDAVEVGMSVGRARSPIAWRLRGCTPGTQSDQHSHRQNMPRTTRDLACS